MSYDPGLVAASLIATALPIVAVELLLRGVFAERLGGVLRIGFAIPLGLAASALSFLAALQLTGRPPAWWMDAGLWLAVGCAGLLVGPRRERTTDRSRFEPRMPVPIVLRIAFATVVAFAATGFVLQQIRDPFGGSDAVAIWNLHARVLVELPSEWTDFLGTHGNETAFHADYPLLVPAAVARIWSIGGASGPAPSLVAGAFLVGTVCLLFGALSRFRGPITATFCTTILLSSVYFVRTSAFQFADAPFACYLLAVIVAASLSDLDEPRADRRFLVLAGLLAGGAASVKNEGLLLQVVLGTVWTVFGISKLRSSGASNVAGATWALAVGLLPGVAFTGWHKLCIAPPSELLVGQSTGRWDRIGDLERYGIIARFYASELFALAEFGGVALVAHLLVRGWLKHAPWRTPAWLGASVITLLLAGYALVYVTTPYDLAWHIGASLRRLYVHVWPLGLFVYGLVAAEPFVVATKREQGATRAEGQTESLVRRAA